MQEFKAGSTSKSVNVFIQDSTSTTGAGLSGLVYNSSGLTAYYSFTGVTATGVAITLATLATVTTAWASGGFIEIDATHMKGWYRLDLPDAALAASKGPEVSLHLYGATNMAPCPVKVKLTGWDNQDAVHGGMSALPNAAAEASGGLYTRGTGVGQINQDANGRIDANAKAWIGGAIPAVNVTGVPLVDAKYLLGTIFPTPTVAGIPNVNVKTWNDLATVALPLVPTMAGRTLDVSAGGEAGMDWANIGSPTTAVGLTGTTIASSQVVASVSGAVGSVTGNVGGNVTGSVGSIAAGGLTAASFAAGAIDAAAIADGAIDAGAIASGAITSAKFAAGAITAAVIATDAIDADSLAADAVAEIQTGLSTLTAAGVRTAVGLAAADLDAQLSGISSKTANLPSDPASESLIIAAANAIQADTDDIQTRLPAALVSGRMAANAQVVGDKTGYALASAGLDQISVETGMNARQALSIIGSALAGILSGAGTTTVTIKAANDGATTRIQATVDPSTGNRSAVTLTLPT